jgi:hypothetical protein
MTNTATKSATIICAYPGCTLIAGRKAMISNPVRWITSAKGIPTEVDVCQAHQKLTDLQWLLVSLDQNIGSNYVEAETEWPEEDATGGQEGSKTNYIQITAWIRSAEELERLIANLRRAL